MYEDMSMGVDEKLAKKKTQATAVVHIANSFFYFCMADDKQSTGWWIHFVHVLTWVCLSC